MNRATAQNLERWAGDLLLRGCMNLEDPEDRRRAVVLNATSYAGIVVAALFSVIAAAQGRFVLAAVLALAILAMVFSVRLRHRTHNAGVSEWLGLSATAALFLYLVARGGGGETGHVWTPMFPLLAMFCLGRVRGALLSAVYLLLVAAVLFVPGLPAVTSVYPAALAGRLLAATMFTGLIALFYEHSSQTAYARLRNEIEERRRAEAELRRTEAEAVRASQAKSEFLAALSHEVRTPLSAITGLNELLLDTELNSEQRRFIQLGLAAGRSLIAVMEDILDLARVEAGKLELVPVPFDLRALVEGIVDLQRALAASRPVSVGLDWQPDVPRYVVGDPNRLRQVLVNLVGNAVKFTAEGHVTLRVEREAAADTAVRLRLSVEDTGIGLTPELSAAIFEPFVRGEAAREHGGSGLGLAISKRLVQAMGGEIGARPGAGGGAVFWVRLSVPPSDGPPSLPRAAGRYRGRVLVVEDNEVSREVLRLMVERLGGTVTTATNGEEAIVALGAGRFELVLMDCQMPVLDGWAATRRIRALEGPGRRTPVVAITAYALPEDTQRCRDAGMDGHLLKPLTPESLAVALQRWLEPEGAVTPGAGA